MYDVTEEHIGVENLSYNYSIQVLIMTNLNLA